MWSPFGYRKEQRTFWVTLCVDLAEPIEFDNEPAEGVAEMVVGYYQHFGVTTSTATLALETAKSSALQGRTAGIVRPDTTSVREVDVRRLDESVRRRVGNAWKKVGIWYSSGRAFFPAEEPGDGAEH